MFRDRSVEIALLLEMAGIGGGVGNRLRRGEKMEYFLSFEPLFILDATIV